MKNLLTLLGLMGLLPLCVQAGAGLRGFVVENNGDAVVYANVILYAAEDSSIVKIENTDEAGLFSMTNLPSGRHFLEISYVGLADFQTDVFQLEEDQVHDLEKITMHNQGTELQEVTVTAKKPLVEVRPDMTVFNVDAAVNAVGNDGMELLRRAPGVVVDNNDNIMLLGKSGVRVFIDGKPSPLSAADLAIFLRNIQASEIEAIEVITSPSARYEAEGNAGIINIRMKKDKSLGTNGSLDLGYSVSTHSRYNGSVGLNHRNTQVNVFGKYSYNEGNNSNYNDFFRIQNDSYFEQHTRRRNSWDNHNVRLGADFFLAPKHTLGFLATGYMSSGSAVGNTSTEISEEATRTPYSLLLARIENVRDNENLNFNLNYRFDNSDGTTWNIDGDYAYFSNMRESYQPNRYVIPETGALDEEVIYGIDTPAEIDLLSFKVDHERPLLGGQLATGMKVSYVVTDNDFQFYNYIDGEPVYAPMLSNRFEYTENINAIYAQYQRQLDEKTSMQAGLRMEHTHSVGDLTSEQQTDNNRVERDYVDFFPSAGISRQLDQKNSLRLGYSYRVDRPRYHNLNPFEYRLDELTFQRGNPFLRPQYTHNVELTHTFNYRYNTTLSFSHTNDLITEITDTLSGNRAFISERNLATQQVISLNFSAPFTVTEWWNAFANASVYRTSNEGVFEEGKTIDASATAYNFYMQHTFSLPADLTLEVSGWYNSPTIWGGNFETEEMYSIDAGLSTKVLQGRGRLRVSVSDIFHTQQWRGVNTFGGLWIDASGGWESRQLRCNFTYNFGNQEVKSSRRRKTGLEDEKNRVDN